MEKEEMNEETKVKNRKWLKYVILGIFLIVIIVVTVLLTKIITPYIEDLGKYGYFGVFILGVITNASVIIPVPIISLPILTGVASQFDPYSIAVVYALGATLGESVSYGAGSIGRKIIDKIVKKKIISNNSFLSQGKKVVEKYTGLAMLNEEKNRKEGFYHRLERWLGKITKKWLKKYGGLAIFVLALQPILPFDVAGIIAGSVKYPYWKFFTFCFAGRTIKYIIMIVLGIELWKVIFH